MRKTLSLRFLTLCLITSLLISCQDTNPTKTDIDSSAFVETQQSDDFIEESGIGNAPAITGNGQNVLVSSVTSFCVSDSQQDKPTKSEINKRKKLVKKKSSKIIYTGSLRFQVLNVNESTDSIKAICNRYGATISKLNLSSTRNQISNSIEIRIAQGNFNTILPLLKKQSVKMDAVNLKSRDVTAEFIDIASRLKTKKSARDRYIEVLRKKADKVRDIIEAEEAIRSITEEIEAKEGRLRYLKDKVQFSTITLNIYEKTDTPEVETYYKPFTKKMKDAAINGWGIITHLFLFLINIWPLALLIGFLYWKRKWLKSKWG